MQRYTDLKVWQRSEQFELPSRLRRAMVSVPTNIAEGAKRRSNAALARFVNIAEASLAESDYLLLLARDLGSLNTEVADSLRSEAEEISRMLSALHQRIQETL